MPGSEDPSEIRQCVPLGQALGTREQRGGSDPGTTVRFWGVRGGLPIPGAGTVRTGGNTCCVEVRTGNQVIILDAGTGIHELGHALTAEFKGRELNLALLISHTHWAHIQGFPYFEPAFNPRAKIRILGYESAVGDLASAFARQMESPYFPVELSQLAARLQFEESEEMRFEIGPVAVRTTFTNHCGVSLAFRLETPVGVVVYLPDHEFYVRQERQGQEESGKSDAAALGFAKAEDDKLVRFADSADVLICDSQYDAAEYPARVGWGHACLDDTVGFALAARVKYLRLFHHDPDHDDEQIDAMVAHARSQVAKSGQPLDVDAAREGQQITIGSRGV